MSERRELNWPDIQQQVWKAVPEFMAAAGLAGKAYINVRRMGAWLSRQEKRHSLDLITGIGSRTAQMRCSEAMRRMGWKEFSHSIYVIGEGPVVPEEVVPEGAEA
jgi:hypothetical protein